jgi:hypothetical protein
MGVTHRSLSHPTGAMCNTLEPAGEKKRSPRSTTDGAGGKCRHREQRCGGGGRVHGSHARSLPLARPRPCARHTGRCGCPRYGSATLQRARWSASCPVEVLTVPACADHGHSHGHAHAPSHGHSTWVDAAAHAPRFDLHAFGVGRVWSMAMGASLLVSCASLVCLALLPLMVRIPCVAVVHDSHLPSVVREKLGQEITWPQGCNTPKAAANPLGVS